VATDHASILEVIVASGGEAVLTSTGHPSGTDRAAEVSSRPEFADYAIVVNVQGDEPEVSPEHVLAPLALVAEEGWEIGTCAAPLGSEAAWRDPAVVKVARGADGRALYFSRAPIPHSRDEPFAPGDPRWLHHVGVYVYARAALARWVELPQSPLEQLEHLEQLRALEAGISIGVAVVSAAARGIDTEQDLLRAEARWGSADDSVSARFDPTQPTPSETR
jgi:3-deoxy-manno-octulosonate cytidylyltransferase (CMP-KDO synthetase)